VIIVTYVDVDDGEVSLHQPSVVLVDEENRPTDPR
jgi:aspartate 1-decarboxylase